MLPRVALRPETRYSERERAGMARHAYRGRLVGAPGESADYTASRKLNAAVWDKLLLDHVTVNVSL